MPVYRWADILCLYCLTKRLVFDKGVISDENPVGRFGRIYPIDDIEMTLTPPASGFYWLDADVDDLAELRPLLPA